jgi:hypothetical protein
MNKNSWLIHNISRSPFPDSAYQQIGFLKLGSTLEETTDNELTLPESFSNFSKLCILAEEAILRIACGKPVPENILKHINRIKPFGEDYPSAGELISSSSSAAVFPLINANDRTVETAHIWLIKDIPLSFPDQKHLLEGISRFHISDNVKIYISSSKPNSSIGGESWQLAFKMAELGLSDIELKKRIAKNWIFTGKVEAGNNRICSVVINGKLKLETDRSWLIPKASHYTNHERVKVKTAGTLREAYNWVKEEGIHPVGYTEWPENIYELHSFVSRAVTPVIASAVLSGAKRIVLWHSNNAEESEKPAGYICAMLRTLLPDCEIAEPKLISSSDLFEAEKALEEYFNKTQTTENIIFNITQGNRLMSLAPHYLARKNPRIWLVYRDRDSAKNLDYTAINYKHDGDSPTTMLLEAPSIPGGVNWNCLSDKASVCGFDWHKTMLMFLNSQRRITSWQEWLKF